MGTYPQCSSEPPANSKADPASKLVNSSRRESSESGFSGRKRAFWGSNSFNGRKLTDFC
jgi:hypothetical protein